MANLFSKERIRARHGFNRWLVPPAALAIHLCIGQAYAFSVFNLPLSRAIGVHAPAPGDWKLTELGWVFTLAIVVLGLSAAFGGRWLERAGPRQSGTVAAACWGLGFLLSAVGVRLHAISLLYLGYGVIGGCGLGLGYITPVGTLIRWFPDRRGLATGLAIMGFGGGAMIASPLSQWLMTSFATPTSVGVAETFEVLGAVYLVVMLAGAFAFRVPPPDWRPPGWVPPPPRGRLFTPFHVHPTQALLTPAFYCLWGVLFLNVTAGIGVLGQASAMSQEMFPGRITAYAASGFVGLLSLFNLLGRFAWSSASDRLGRKMTYSVFFLLGAVLYALVPWSGQGGSVALFVACFAVIMSMYGGGFATVPAYLADVFGTEFVGAIHGRLLTAWSAAGVAGPVLVNYIREYQIAHGLPASAAYDLTMYVMASLLAIGLGCNLAVRPVPDRFYLTPEQLEQERRRREKSAEVPAAPDAGAARPGGWGLVCVAWALVLLPLAWGVFMTFRGALRLFVPAGS